MRYLNRVILLFIAVLLSACHTDKTFVEMGVARDCDTAEALCTVSTDKTSVSLRLGPDVVPLQPFDAVVTISGMPVDANSVVTDFQMKGMDMGVNRYRMIGDKGKWKGTVTLPVCSASRMDWIALVEFTSNGTSYRARFPFATAAAR